MSYVFDFARVSVFALLLSTAVVSAIADPAVAPNAAAEADWARITQLDAGPKGPFRTQEEARTGSLAHLSRQEKALREFLAAHPGDQHEFEAGLRLARLLQIRAGFQNSDAARAEARRILDDLTAKATGAQRPEVDFARIAFMMRSMKGTEPRLREDLVVAARRFQAEYPEDRRVASLLAEVATIFDREPETKRSLLLEAQKSAPNPDLSQRIADDLKRLDFLGKPIALHFNVRQGAVDITQFRGKVVVLVFFGDFSPPSTEAVGLIQQAAREWPAGAVQILGVSLDSKAENLAAAISRYSINWPVAFDGRGWMGAIPRSFGVNTLPTVWLIDRQGVLRALDGLHGLQEQVRALLRER